jgi:elongation factor Ts
MTAATVSAQQVKSLRDQTGSGMMDAKRALEASDGDIERAKDWLRQKGIAKAGARSRRVAQEGLVETYVHHNQQLATLVELNCETDFVARSEAFKELAHELAVHIAASAPRYVRLEEVPSEVIEQKREAFRTEAVRQNKPPQFMEMIIDGKLREFYKREVLLDQPWAKDDSQTVDHVLAEAIARFGENITVARFARFRVNDDQGGADGDR